MTSLAARERRALVDALTSAGPDAPTLCSGWQTRHLAAHLVIRERRPDTVPGLLSPRLSAWTERVLHRQSERPYAELVREIEVGPPWFSPFALPGVDAAANLAEHFVHTEDVLRAQPGWAPRTLGTDDQGQLWATLVKRARLLLRKAPVPLLLVTTDETTSPEHAQIALGPDPSDRRVTLAGAPAELILYAHGRADAAQLQITGPDDAVRALAAFRPKV